jgi:hypothetical protein
MQVNISQKLSDISFERYKRTLSKVHPTDHLDDRVLAHIRAILGRAETCFLQDHPSLFLVSILNHKDSYVRRIIVQAQEAERLTADVQHKTPSPRHIYKTLSRFDRDVLKLLGLRILFPEITALTIDALSAFYKEKSMRAEQSMPFFFRWMDAITAIAFGAAYIVVLLILNSLANQWSLLTYILAIGVPLRLLTTRGLRRPLTRTLTGHQNRSRYVAPAFFLRSDSWRKFWFANISRFASMIVSFAVWANSISRLFPDFFVIRTSVAGIEEWLRFALETIIQALSFDVLDVFLVKISSVRASGLAGRLITYVLKVYVLVFVVETVVGAIKVRLAKEPTVY